MESLLEQARETAHEFDPPSSK
jgi:hypothetical protein